MGRLNIDGVMICVLKNLGAKVWTGFSWFSVWSSGGFLWSR